MIKSFKIFEASKYWQQRVDNIMNKVYSAKIGDIIPEDIIYQYIEILHNEEDFIDGDLPKRIEKYSSYKLIEVDVTDLNIDEYYLFEDLVEDYIKEYEKRGSYPPPVITHKYELIDGNHRANALHKLGIDKIKVFKGIK